MLTKTRLKTDLERILPKNNILSAPAECYVYSQDGTNVITSEILPDAVVFPETVEDVQDILRFANRHSLPVVPRGAGTNLVGACIPERGGIVMHLTKMNKILELNKVNMTMQVQPCVTIDEIQQSAMSAGLFFPPDPSNLKVSTIGGAIAQSAGGPKTFKYGTTKDYILGLKVVLADGSILNTGSSTIKNATGYHLEQLFVGSEGTLGIVVEAVLKLIPKPETSSVVLAYFDDIETATDSVSKMTDAGLCPSAMEFMNKNTLQTIEMFYPAGLLTDKEAALIIELDGFKSTLPLQVSKLEEILSLSGASNTVIADTEEEQERIWTSRRASFAACAKLGADVISHDLIVPRENISKLVCGVNAICKKYDLHVCIAGHIGDGNIHPQIGLDLNNETDVYNYEKAKAELYELTLGLNGTLSAEHGIGMEKRMFMEKAVDKNTLEYMKKIKQIFDPNNILNPSKIFL